MIQNHSRLGQEEIELRITAIKSDRVRRLLVTAIARDFFAKMKSKQCIKAVEFAEQYVDMGLQASFDLTRWHGVCKHAANATGENPKNHYFASSERVNARYLAEIATMNFVPEYLVMRAIHMCVDYKRARPIKILDCILQPRTYIEGAPPSVVGIARDIYETKNFALMPVLADALEDYLPDEGEMIRHCRDAHHWKGCWVIDSLGASYVGNRSGYVV